MEGQDCICYFPLLDLCNLWILVKICSDCGLFTEAKIENLSRHTIGRHQFTTFSIVCYEWVELAWQLGRFKKILTSPILTHRRRYWKQENRWNSIYFRAGEKYEQTTVTFKEPLIRKKTTQVRINWNSLSYFTKPVQKTTRETESSCYQKAQPCRLSC